MSAAQVEEKLKSSGLIAILRKVPQAELLPAAEAAIAGGVEAIEITMETTGALEAIAELSSKYQGKVLVGAGTVMSKEDLHRAVEAGATFLLSPHLDVDLVQEAYKLDRVMVPGILTPTEVVLARRAGASVLKLFPAGALGTGYLKDMLGPFSGHSFVPTGGITPDNAAEFIRAGAVAVGMGSALVPKDLIANREFAALTQRVAETVQRIQAARPSQA
ncbi:bifunctional 4-hydroxy-2-oxoglutarate aldolase/2-dehydro-3-deoxy-phosphogluconate aldolase [Alicyclobacillus tolerans]|uniref:bifunctional 4-hydroxy-2-oxoglutarate aldolase/2-dehydro-3-deoxy-phosphogluconate aldolase n=1 Tax=Alicyclobacillus tolerans TaxID=90970 RepID=UPI001F2CBFB1|nr:bifunctional 4-hydroxy-2-oxoglutarate aldolase/2-dehydro-3-deoxy-phosphogluconate aldolase [Alicyclobacillus tolerans]MCF8565844.1 bifunctional 4-hydroxy-2-oxoglutarate aldolase/2-dehydro-3-deoxy-phosphogluconate aldolase [Alicyclobacillus tolerans]